MTPSPRPTRRVSLALAVAVSVAGLARAGDWPTYKADAARSGISPEKLAFPLRRAWSYAPAQPPRPAWPQPGKEVHRIDFDYAYQPVVAAGVVYFGSSADDSVRAVDALTGRLRWRFTTGGPVRLAPTIAGGKCYAGSDDGCVYCLDAATGKRVWTFRGAPSDRRLLGNGRMISRWPIRTGVLVAPAPGSNRPAAYFAAGTWPSDGVYLCALDAETGKLIWRNGRIGSMYLDQPHRGASAFTGVAPQGYLLASKDMLLVPTGRSVPAAFDRRTGRLAYYRPGDSKFGGGCWATLAGEVYFNATHPQQLDDEAHVGEAPPRAGDGLAAYQLADGDTEGGLFLRDKQLVIASGQTLYAVGDGSVQAVAAAKLRTSGDPNAAARWTADHGRGYCMALADEALLVGGAGTVSAYDVYTGERLWLGEVPAQARGLAVADGRIVVATSDGEIICFSGADVPASPRRTRERLTWRALPPGAHHRLAADAARAAGASRGYALVVGAADSRLAVSLAMRTDLHVLCVFADEARAAAERERVLTTNLYGSRVAVECIDDLARLPYAPYFADLVLVARETKRLSGRELFRVLRPCGGVMCLAADAGEADRLIRESGVPRRAVRSAGNLRLLTRGPLPGAGEWRHQWANPAQTGCGSDRLVRLPLEMLWFGGPGPDRMMDRHWATSTPLFVGGRVFVTAQHHVIAFDAYNGRENWSREIPSIGRRGAVFVAGGMVADDDSLYVAHHDLCHRLDQATGRTLAVYQMPEELTVGPDEGEPAPPPVEVDWPTTWQVFGPLPKETRPADGNDVAKVPKELTIGGRTYRPTAMKAVRGVLDFSYLYGGFGFEPLKPGQRPKRSPPREGRRDMEMHRKAVYAFAQIDCAKPGRLIIGAGCDWYMAWYLDGKKLYDTLRQGNRAFPYAITNHVFSVDVSAGRHVLAAVVQSGSRGWCLVSAGGAKYAPQLAAALLPPPARWGFVSRADGLLLASYVDPNAWSGEASALFALGAADGSPRWVRRARGVFKNAGIALADGRLFALEAPASTDVDRAKRRGQPVDANQTLVALDLASGKDLWRRRGVPPVGPPTVQVARGVVVVAGRQAYHAETGKPLWQIDPADYSFERSPVVVGDLVYTHPGAVDLKTGRPRQTTDLLTGRRRPWGYARAYGCGHVGACGSLLFFRSGTAGFHDILRDGTTTIGGLRPGCSVTMIPAGGLMILPEASSGCTCSYNFQTSAALVPSGGREAPWYVFHGEPLAGPLKHLRLNFAAPGDRRNGPAAWLAFPRPAMRGACPVPVTLDMPEPSLRHLPPGPAGPPVGKDAWLYASALAGEGKITVRVWAKEQAKKTRKPAAAPAAPAEPAERTFTVRMHFLEPTAAKAGRRVFDVAVQGKTVLKGFDIFAAAGGRQRPVVREVRGVRAKDKLTVALRAVKALPLLCGLGVLAEEP